MFFKSKEMKVAEKKMDAIILELQMNLENNYKDLAIAAHKDAVALLALYQEQGSLQGKVYDKYEKRIAEYTKMMEGYNHQQFYRS